MKYKYFAVLLICFLIQLSYGQKPPLPPKPPTASYLAKNKIYADDSNKGKKKAKTNEKVEIVEVTDDNSAVEEKKVMVSTFKVSLNESSNSKSIYYYKNVEDLLTKLDTAKISAEQIISLTKYKIHTKAIKPAYLDSLAGKAYKLNEEKKYDEAIVVAKQILDQSPNNITGHKESSYAYRKLGNMQLSNAHFEMMVKIINSVFKYGEGTRFTPYILNNFFEGLSIYEAKFGCFPKKTRLILTSEKVLLGGYDCFHIMRFANFNHWLPSLKPEDYKTE